jgi:hypothetical protein
VRGFSLLLPLFCYFPEMPFLAKLLQRYECDLVVAFASISHAFSNSSRNQSESAEQTAEEAVNASVKAIREG